MQPVSPRFTALCLDELGIIPPSLKEGLYSFAPEHELLKKVKTMYQLDDGGYERIKSIDDNVFIKCKVDRFRGAVWEDSKESNLIWWVVSAGYRVGDSTNDFYNEIETKSKNKLKEARKGNPSLKPGKTTNSDWLLPTSRDYLLLAGAKLYYQNVLWKRDIIDTFEKACDNLNMPINYVFSYESFNTLIEFKSEDDCGAFVILRSNNYEFLVKTVAVIVSSLGLDHDSYEDHPASYLENSSYKYVKNYIVWMYYPN